MPTSAHGVWTIPRKCMTCASTSSEAFATPRASIGRRAPVRTGYSRRTSRLKNARPYRKTSSRVSPRVCSSVPRWPARPALPQGAPSLLPDGRVIGRHRPGAGNDIVQRQLRASSLSQARPCDLRVAGACPLMDGDHFDDDVLAQYAESPDSLDEITTARLEAHLR